MVTERDNAGVTKNVSKMWEDYAKAHGKSVNHLTMAEKRQAEYNGILYETRNQVGDAAKLTNELSGQLSKMGAETKQAKAAVGDALEPQLAKLVGTVGALVSRFTEWARENPRAIAGLITFAAAATGGVAALSGIALALPTIVNGLGLLKSGAMLAANGVKVFNAAMAANPMGAVVAAIGFVVGALITLYNTNETARAYMDSAWGSIKIAVLSAVETVLGALQKLVSFIPGLANKIQGFRDELDNMIDSAKAYKAAEELKQQSQEIADYKKRERDAWAKVTEESAKAWQASKKNTQAVNESTAAGAKQVNILAGVKTALSNVDLALRDEENSWKKLSLTLDENKDRTQYLTAEEQHLINVKDLLAAKAANLQHAIEKASAAKGKDAEETRSLAAEVINLKGQLSDLSVRQAENQHQMENTTKAMGEMSKEMRGKIATEANRLNDALKSAIRDRYETERTESLKARDAVIADAQKVYDEKVSLLDKELDATLRNIDAEMNWRMGGLKNARVEAINDQIKAINDLTEAEDRTREEQQYLTEKAELEKRVASATTDEERKKAQDELTKLNNDHTRKVLRDQRQSRIDALREESSYLSDIAGLRTEMAKAESDEERRRLESDLADKLERMRKGLGDEAYARAQAMLAEFDAAETAANNERQLAQEEHDKKVGFIKEIQKSVLDSLKEQRKAAEQYYKDLLSEASLNAESQKLILEGHTDEIVALLGDKGLSGGETFGDQLVQGILNKQPAIRQAVSDTLALIGGLPAVSSAGGTGLGLGRGGASYESLDEAGKRAMETDRERLLIDPVYRQSEVERTLTVIANRKADGKDTAAQEKYLKDLQSLPGLAEGGTVVSSGLVKVGERGEEVVNLPRGAQVVPLDNSGLQRGNTFNFHQGAIQVSIPVSELGQIKDIIDFFRRLPQVARAMG